MNWIILNIVLTVLFLNNNAVYLFYFLFTFFKNISETTDYQLMQLKKMTGICINLY